MDQDSHFTSKFVTTFQEIKWLEPREPKGNLTAYHLSAEITYDNPLILEQRNYCTEREYHWSFLVT